MDSKKCWQMNTAIKSITGPSCLVCPSSQRLTLYPLSGQKGDTFFNSSCEKKIMLFSINPALSPVSPKMLGCMCTLLRWGGTSNFFQSVVKDLRAQRWMEILKPLQQDLLRCQQLPVQTQVSPDCLIELNCSGGNYKRIWICHWLFWKLWLWKNMLF